MENRVKMTQEGYDKLEEELEHLKVVKRKDVAQNLKEALSFGDLSENSEYTLAVSMRDELESKINNITDRLNRAEIVERSQDTSIVNIGLKVKVRDEENKEIVYEIVGDNEGDIEKLKLSTSSPVGEALMGNPKGVLVDINVPNGSIEYKILDIYTQ